MNKTTDLPPDDGAWAHIRARYEQDQETVQGIAESIGISGKALSGKAKQWGWLLRGKLRKKAKQKAAVVQAKPAKTESTRTTIKRLKELLQKRVTQLEDELKEIGGEINALKSEREIRSTNTLVRTLEKVLDLERKERHRQRQRRDNFKHFDEAERLQLAAKIEKLQDAWHGEKTVDGTADRGSDGVEPPVAILGETTKPTAA